MYSQSSIKYTDLKPDYTYHHEKGFNAVETQGQVGGTPQLHRKFPTHRGLPRKTGYPSNNNNNKEREQQTSYKLLPKQQANTMQCPASTISPTQTSPHMK